MLVHCIWQFPGFSEIPWWSLRLLWLHCACIHTWEVHGEILHDPTTGQNVRLVFRKLQFFTCQNCHGDSPGHWLSNRGNLGANFFFCSLPVSAQASPPQLLGSNPLSFPCHEGPTADQYQQQRYKLQHAGQHTTTMQNSTSTTYQLLLSIPQPLVLQPCHLIIGRWGCWGRGWHVCPPSICGRPVPLLVGDWDGCVASCGSGSSYGHHAGATVGRCILSICSASCKDHTGVRCQKLERC